VRRNAPGSATALMAVAVLTIGACKRVEPVQARPNFERVCSDSFDRGTTPWTLGASDAGQLWETGPLSRWGIRDLHAYVSRLTEYAVATIDCAATGDLLIQADVTLSPTAGRANVGLVFRFADPQNYLWAKLKVTTTDPDGAIGIGKVENGLVVTPTLGSLARVGLRNGETYHLALAIRGPKVSITVSGGSLPRPVSLSYSMTAEEMSTFGAATGVGMLARWFGGDPVTEGDPAEDEDDGGSSWDNFVVSRI
jgi:hypothetical protein